MTNLSSKYYITSNKESGRGRYDLMLEPKDKSENAYIMEFKVYRDSKDKDVFETIEKAKKQIEEKQYDRTLKEKGITNIYKMVYAFDGKDVEIVAY